MQELKHGDLIWLFIELLLTYFSRIKFTITSRTTLFTASTCHIHIIFHHFVYLYTQLLVHLISNYSCIDKESNQKTNSHQKKNNKNSLPQTNSLIVFNSLVVLLDKFDTLWRRINQRVTNCLKDLRSFKETIKITIVNRSFRIKKYSKLFRLLERLLQYIFFIFFNISISLLNLLFYYCNCRLRDLLFSHCRVRTILNIFSFKADILIKIRHILPPQYLLIWRFQ